MGRLSLNLFVITVVTALVGATPQTVCQSLQTSLSSGSAIYQPGTTAYDQALSHSSPASTQRSACVVVPATAADVSIVLTAIGNDRSPFAVKGGGHCMNPGCSSTTGVHISMAKFDTVVYNASYPGTPNGAVTYGAGLLWNHVYAALDPLNVTVAGGRASGVGVAGFTLGGGYSFYSNQYGLTVDTLVAYELVLPNGTVTTVTMASDSELFWALKGGLNNFGIVTRFTVQAIPYTQIWGGLRMHVGQHEELAEAVVQFESTITDPKAMALPTFIRYGGIPMAAVLLWYDGPSPPAGTFDAFTSVGALFSDLKARKMLDFIEGTTNFNPVNGMRGAFDTIAVPQTTVSWLDIMRDELHDNAASLFWVSGTYVSYTPEPFVPTHLTRYNRTSESAWPPTPARTSGGMPMDVYYAWTNPDSDTRMRTALRQSVAKLQAALPGSPLPKYPNYSLVDTPLEAMYGATNLARLRAVAQRVDPDRVMTLAGGFKVQ